MSVKKNGNLKRRHVFSLILVFVVGTALIIPPRADTSENGSDVNIIVNAKAPVSQISKEDIKEIFLGRKARWKDGQQIVVVTSKQHEVHKQFVIQYTDMTPFQFMSWWRRLLFTGKGLLPLSFKTEQELTEYIANNNGAIGYLSFRPQSDRVKVIQIEGE